MDEATERILKRFIHDLKHLPNEAAKTHRFAGLISELFPGTSAPLDFAEGVEKIVRIDTVKGERVRRIDAYHGNAIIEFENSLKATEHIALNQLRQYTSGVWREEGKRPRPLICVATDGITWKTYRPRLVEWTEGGLRPEDVHLDELQTITLSKETKEKLGDFWFWLTGLLFRSSQTAPTADRFRFDFGSTSAAFADALEILRIAWCIAREHPEPCVAFETWKRYLTLTYGSLKGDLETLFLKHTYLASVARILVWASISHGQTKLSLRETADEVLSGRFFKAQRIETLVEDDFFQWVRRSGPEKILAPLWERIFVQTLTYDLSRLDQDVLKSVYQELVDPEDRHDLGEYYTPDWLCERIVAELLPEQGFVSVIDPTCGSGSFLRAVINHMLRTNCSDENESLLRSILDNVVGIDIHPLAVTIARATYVIAIRGLLKASKRPLQVPVYLADSLFLPTEVSQPTLGIGKAPTYEIRFGDNRKVEIPEHFVQSPDLFDPGIAACAEVAIDHARTGHESEKSLRAYLAQVSPTLLSRRDSEQIVSSLWSFTKELAELIKQNQDTIWAFIVRNAYRPAMLRNRFDFVIGNPPWLSYRYIKVPSYQKEIKKRAVREYRIAPASQTLITHMELATTFLVHALTTFGREKAHLGFVMPRSVLSADQHHNLRVRSYNAPVKLYKYWDMVNVKPIFNVPSCVLFANKEEVQPKVSYSLPCMEWSGRLPVRDCSWKEASTYLKTCEGSARIIYLGSRSAFSTMQGRTSPTLPGPYAKRFRQGATLLPRNFFFVHIPDLVGGIDPDRVCWAETDPDQAKLAKKPWDEISMSGSVEGRFVCSTALSRHLLPFTLLTPSILVLPIMIRDGQIDIRTASELKAEGYREFGSWVEKLESIWTELREEKANSFTIYQWLDYQGKLTAQSLTNRYMVLYNAAGTNLSAASVDRESLSLPFIVEHKLYWCACESEEEADYLAAILNASFVNEAIKPFQSRGLQGERDIEMKVLDLPIPNFKRSNHRHLAISKLGERAKKEAEGVVSGTRLPTNLARRRALVRNVLGETMSKIDEKVRGLLK